MISTLIILFWSILPLQAGTINLQWNAAPESTGYRVYYGTAPGQYSSSIDVGGSTSVALNGLADCTEYFIAVKSYNAAGESTEFSNEISGWSRPSIGTVSPREARQGAQLTIQLRGANFTNGASLLYEVEGLPMACMDNGTIVGPQCASGGDCPVGACRELDLVRLQNVSVVACDTIEALLTVEPTTSGQRAMEVGDFTVQFEVLNPDLTYGVHTSNLRIDLDETRVDLNRDYVSTIDRVDGWDHNWWARKHGSCMIPASVAKPCSADNTDRYDPDWDIDGDGWVDGDELAEIATRFGACWNGSAWTMEACN